MLVTFSRDAVYKKNYRPEMKLSFVRPDNHFKASAIFARLLVEGTDNLCLFVVRAKLLFLVERIETYPVCQLVITSQKNVDMFKSL